MTFIGAINVPPFVARLFGGADDCAGRQVAYEFVSQSVWPWWASLLLLAALLAFAVFVYRREQTIAGRRAWPLAVVRATLFALIVFMLQGWVLQPYCADPPDLALVIDASSSMQIEDAYDRENLQRAVAALSHANDEQRPSREQLAKSLLLADDGARLRSLAENYKIKLYLAGDAARSRSIDPNDLPATIESIAAQDSSSRLGAALRDVIESQRGQSTAAIVMLTDGAVTAGISLDEAAAHARRRRIPLFFIGLGAEKPPRDVRLSDLAADDVVFVDDLAHFDLSLAAPGYAGKEVVVRLRQQGVDQPLAEQTVSIGEDGAPQRIRLSHRPHQQGEFTYTVEAESLAGEASDENNALTATVRVSDETIRVLLVQEYPSWDYRELKTLLSRGLRRAGDDDETSDDAAEKSFDLSVVLQDADVEFVQFDETAKSSVPIDREELFKYDVIVFGDVDRTRLSRSALQAIADFVQIRGGGLVLVAGPRHTPLAYRDTPLEDLFPFRFGAVVPAAEEALDVGEHRAAPTDFGLQSGLLQVADDVADSRAVWSELPPLRWLLPINQLKPAARVLAESTAAGNSGDPLPIVSMQYVGAGKVVFIATDESYRWANYQQRDDRYYARFWMQTLRALGRAKILGKGRQVEITSDRDQYEQGDVVRLRLEFFDDRLAPPDSDAATLIVEQAGGLQRRVELARSGARRGEFSGALSDLAPGSYRVWLSEPPLTDEAPAHRFTVTAPPGELGRPQMAAAELRRAADASGGEFYTLATAHRLSGDLPAGQTLRVAALAPRPIWNSPLVAGLFVALITLEWLFRKRAGLL